MNFKKLGIVLLLIFFLSPLTYVGAQTSAGDTNTGFVPGNIWYSQEKLEEGNKVKIYTVIFNGDARELSGVVSFYDDLTLLGKKNFVITGKGVKDINIDWTIKAGKHTIYATITNSKYLVSPEKYQNVILEENETDKSIFTINKKIVPSQDTSDKSAILETENTENEGAVDNIAHSISENTPDVISKPIIASVGILENIRNSLSSNTELKKTKLQTELEVLRANGVVTADAELEDSKVQTKSNSEKPLKNIALFFVSIFHFIFKHVIVFYLLLLAILLYMVRYIISIFS